MVEARDGKEGGKRSKTRPVPRIAAKIRKGGEEGTEPGVGGMAGGNGKVTHAPYAARNARGKSKGWRREVERGKKNKRSKIQPVARTARG